MSTTKLLKQLSKIRESLDKKDKTKIGVGALSSVQKMVTKAKELFDNMDSDDKKTMRKRLNGTLSQFRARRKALSSRPNKPNIANRAMGGSMGGGMNPMGRSPDPTVKSITGYNPNTPRRLKKGGFPDMSGDGKVTKKDVLMGRGVIKRRGGGIAKRGFGIAK
jgi:hypothetical protein